MVGKYSGHLGDIRMIYLFFRFIVNYYKVIFKF